jgi:hypothetical protein
LIAVAWLGLIAVRFLRRPAALSATAQAARAHPAIAAGAANQLDHLDALLKDVDEDLARIEELLAREERERPRLPEVAFSDENLFETLSDEGIAEEDELRLIGSEVFRLQRLVRESLPDSDSQAA